MPALSMTELRSSHVVLVLPAFALSIALTMLCVPLRALHGLRCFWAAAAPPAEAAARGKRVRARGRGGAGAKRDDDWDLGGAESLLVAPVTVRQAAGITYQGAFENLVIAALFALSASAVALAAEHALGWPPAALPVLVAGCSALAALAMLAQVDLLSPTTSPANKAIACFWGLAGFAAALALHVLQPGGGRVLAWDVQRAAAGIGPAVGDVLKGLGSRAVQKGLEAMPHLAVSAAVLQLVLALGAAAIAVLLFAPALRYVQAYWLQMSAPDWAAEYVSPRPAATAGLLLHLLLPLATALLWVRPMVQEPLGLSDRQLALAQAGALLATAAVQAGNLRTLLQRYLDRGLTGWHQLKHGSRAVRGSREEKRSLGDLIRVHCQSVNFLLGKAAVQSLGPAVMHLGLGLVLLHTALRADPAPGSVAEGARAAVQTCAGFLAAWSNACWFAYGAGLLFFFRTGVLQP